MLTIICGEDIVASRTYLNELLQFYKEQGRPVEFITKDLLAQLANQTDEALSLFYQSPVYVIENTNKLIARKGSGDTYKLLELASKKKDLDLISWEGGTVLREVKIASLGKTKEFKPSGTVFTLLDTCYPSNLQNFTTLLTKLTTPQTEMLLYIMLTRHIRNLVYAKLGLIPSYLQSWQGGKLRRQASLWSTEKLLSFYEKLLSLELNLKSGKSILSLSHSLDTLACYYLV